MKKKVVEVIKENDSDLDQIQPSLSFLFFIHFSVRKVHEYERFCKIITASTSVKYLDVTQNQNLTYPEEETSVKWQVA